MGTKKILIVEDDGLIRNLYSRTLEKHGFEVIQAADGKEGYQKMLEGGYDLVLLDIMLPGMNGVDILMKLSKETPPKTPNKKLIVLSNLDEEVVKEDARYGGVDAFWVKNKVDVTKLGDEVEKFLSQ